MGKQTLQSAHPSNTTADHPFAIPANPPPTRPRPNLNGTGTPSSPPKISPLFEKALEAKATSSGFAKSLNGLAQVGDSPLSVKNGGAHSGGSIVGGGFDGRVEAPGGGIIDPDDVRLPYGVVPSRTRGSKGNVSTGAKPPPSKPAALIQPERPRTTTDNHRNFGSRQGIIRTPTSKALLVTADSAPPHGQHEQLDHTANDSERFEECLKRLGFKPEHIKVIKAVGTEFLTYEAFMRGLDFLFSGAANGDILVMLVSMHATYFKDGGSVYLKFVRSDKSVVLVGTQDLVNFINDRLRAVRCTVEVILDICHAAGLIKCKHVIRQTESKNVVVSTIVEADVPPPIETAPLSLTGNHRNEADIPAGHVNFGAQRTIITNTPRRANQAVVAGPSLLPEPVIPSASTYNCNPVAQVLRFIFSSSADLQTASDILVWAAAKEDQAAHERTGGKNGALVDAVCTAIEKKGYLSREEVFDEYVSVIIEEENAAQTEWLKLESAEAQEELWTEPQEAQLLSNRKYKKRILRGNIFQAVPEAQV